jgi:toxin ParE1/3/4
MKLYEVRYSPGAREDISELTEFIASKSSGEIAFRYIASLVRECESLRNAPQRGNKRSDLRPNMRLIGFKRAVSIVFRVEENESLVVILGFSYRGQSLSKVLERDE